MRRGRGHECAMGARALRGDISDFVPRHSTPSGAVRISFVLRFLESECQTMAVCLYTLCCLYHVPALGGGAL